MTKERCSYCGKGHWRPDCPKLAKDVADFEAKRVRVPKRFAAAYARSKLDLGLYGRVELRLQSTPIVARPRKLRARWRTETDQNITAFYGVDEYSELTETQASMKQVNINKSKLLAILTANKAEHKDIFLAAQKKFREVAIKMLDASLKAARTGRPFQLSAFTELVEPQDHTAEYDRAIRMLEMSEDAVITVTDREFQNFVEDRWEWSRDWAFSNMKYVGNQNSRFYGKLSSLANDRP